MGLLATLLLNVPLGLAAYWTARHGFRQAPGLPRALASMVLAWVWATLGMELLGSFGLLSLGPLLGWTGVGLIVGAALRWSGRQVAETDLVDTLEPPRWGWDGVLAVGLVIWGALTLGIPSLLMPVKVVSDGPIYHLYFAARWWKEGRLSLIATPFGENAAPYFPAVGDLWFTWLMTGWGGDRLAKVGQVPFLLTAALTTYGIARRLGASCSASVVATAWFAASTPLLLFTFEPNVDTIFVAGYLLAVYFFLRYALDDRRGVTLALGGLAAGGSLGTKAIGVVFVPVLVLLGGIAITRKGSFSEKIRHVLMLFGSVLVMSGFWYGRNFWLTGNPLYPLHVKIGGHVLLQGWYDSSVMKTSPYYLPVADWRSLLETLLAVLDPRLTILWVLALLGAWAWGAKRHPLSSYLWGICGLAVMNVALYWLLIPYRTQQRFMLQAVGLAAVPLACFLDRSRWLRALAAILLVVHMTTPQSWPFSAKTPPWDLSPFIPNTMPGIVPIASAVEQLLGPSQAGSRSGSSSERLMTLAGFLGLGIGSCFVAWLWSRVKTAGQIRRALLAFAGSLGLFAVASLMLVPLGADPRLLFYPPFRDYYRGWLELDLRAGPSGTRIAYAGTDLPYYLMGVGLRNEVRYINVDSHRDWLLHDYHREAVRRGDGTWPNSRPGWDRIQPGYDAWLQNLRDEEIRLLVVARANPAEGSHNIADAESFPVERVWADTHPETFEPVYGVAERDPNLRIYRLRSAPRDSPYPR